MTVVLRTGSILSPEFDRDPYSHFAYLRESEPVYLEPGIGYFISRYADVERALRNDTVYTTQSLVERAEPVMRGRVLAQMTGAEHNQKRRLVVQGYTGALLRAQVPRVRANAATLIRPFLDTGRVDLVNDFGKQLAVWVTLDSLDLPRDDWEQVAEWHAGIAKFITSLALTDEERAHCVRCGELLEEYLTPFIEERRRNPAGDLISVLSTAAGDARMERRDVVALCLNVLLAATEPIDKTLAYLFRHLADHPEQFAMLRADPGLLTAALAETLRYTPPVHLVPRLVIEPVTIAGAEVPAGDVVFSMIAAANRDPSVFSAPDTFDLRRTDLGANRSFTAAATHMAFGTGLHACIGAAYARAELETVAGLLLELMDDIAVSADDTREETGLYTRGPKTLHLEFSLSREGKQLVGV